MIRPIALLEKQLKAFESAREKSVISFEKGDIDKELHELHIHNLTPMIEEYKYVIRIINQYA